MTWQQHRSSLTASLLYTLSSLHFGVGTDGSCVKVKVSKHFLNIKTTLLLSFLMHNINIQSFHLWLISSNATSYFILFSKSLALFRNCVIECILNVCFRLVKRFKIVSLKGFNVNGFKMNSYSFVNLSKWCNFRTVPVTYWVESNNY